MEDVFYFYFYFLVVFLLDPGEDGGDERMHGVVMFYVGGYLFGRRGGSTV